MNLIAFLDLCPWDIFSSNLPNFLTSKFNSFGALRKWLEVPCQQTTTYNNQGEGDDRINIAYIVHFTPRAQKQRHLNLPHRSMFSLKMHVNCSIKRFHKMHADCGPKAFQDFVSHCLSQLLHLPHSVFDIDNCIPERFKNKFQIWHLN